MESLGQSIGLQELLLLSLALLLLLKLLVDHFLELGLQLDLHYAHLGGHDVAQLLLNCKLGLDVVEGRLQFDEVLAVGLRHLLNRDLSVEVDGLVLVDGLVSQLAHLDVLGVVVVLVVRGDQPYDGLRSLELGRSFLEEGHHLTHALGFLIGHLELLLGLHKVGHRAEIDRVVVHDV